MSLPDIPAPQHTTSGPGNSANPPHARPADGDTGGDDARRDPTGPDMTTPAPRPRPSLGAVVRLLVGVGLPVLLVTRLGADGVLDALAGITAPAVLAALALGAVVTVAGAARWCVVARGVGLTLSLRAATTDAYRAMLLNSLLPAGVLGDVHRAVRHHRPGDARGARAVVLERVAGQAVVVAVGAGVLLAQPSLRAALVGPGPLVAGAALLVVVAVAGAWLATARRAARWRVGPWPRRAPGSPPPAGPLAGGWACSPVSATCARA
ncbi:MAG: dolichol-P-glucose synthetase-like protein [Actinomycetospora sp.]|nr:dolichol-P-glucose synthetase-like protein [Actinomycetospora sp.]